MTTATKIFGMLKNITSSEQIGLYETRLNTWTETQLKSALAKTEGQLYNSHRDTFARHCDLSAFKTGLLIELRRRGIKS
jgi:hypothetical protein